MTKQKTRRSALGGQSRVQEIMQRGLEEQEATLTDGRGRAGNAGQVGKDATGRLKSTFELQQYRQAELERMADALHLSKSDLANLGIAILHKLWRDGKIEGLLSEHRILRYSRNQPWRSKEVLELPAEISLFYE